LDKGTEQKVFLINHQVKKYMFSQGFELKKRNDYLHSGLGIIVEDLHEENVLIRDNTLFFIDTVIYLK